MNRKKTNQTEKILIILISALVIIGIFLGGILMGHYIGSRTMAEKLEEASAAKTVELPSQDTKGAEEVKTDTLQEVTEKKAPEIFTDASKANVTTQEFGDVVATVETNVEHEDIRDDGSLQIVTLGDSIFDMARDGTGIPYLVAESLDARILNLAIGGTCATIGEGESTGDDRWESTCGLGVAKAMAGKVNPDVFFDCAAKNLLKEHKDEFKNTDIFIVEYGINDFLDNRPIGDGAYAGDYYYFVNAMAGIVDTLREVNPNAKIVLCEPHYCDFFGKNGMYLGSSNMFANTYGTLFDYKGKVDYVANYRGTYLFEAYLNSGIDTYTAQEYLLDGIHMTEAGRRQYAAELSNYIKRNVLMMEVPEEEGASESN